MSDQEKFNEANKVMHPVETQWHYPIMTKYGFKPLTSSDNGFVRIYVYEKEGKTITCHTGVTSDYWIDKDTNKIGLWRELEIYVSKL